MANLNSFFYDPDNGDLLLDIRKLLDPTPTLSLGLDFADYTNSPLDCTMDPLDCTQDPLMWTAYANLPELLNPLAGVGTADCTFGCTDALGLITQFETYRLSQLAPILPEVLSTGGFEFTDQPSGSWFDPPTAYGFHYIGTGGTLFTSMTFPTGFTGSLLDSENALLDTFSGGGTYIFSPPYAAAFSITGLTPLVDPAIPTAFPLYLEFFGGGNGSFTMDPLYPPSEVTGSVPEPGSIALLGAGVLMLSILRRIRPCA